MLRFELKKIFSNKLNLVAMVCGYVLIAIVMGTYVSEESTYDPSTDTYLRGKEAFAYEKKLAESQTSELSEEYVTAFLKALQEYPDSLDSDEAYMEVVRDKGELFYYLVNSYADINQNYIPYDILKNVDLSKGAGFYERRREKISDYLNMTFSFGDYTESEKKYWMTKADEVKEPFAWGSRTPVKGALGVLACGFYLLGVVIVCVSPVMARESETGTAQLLLTTKHGKNKLIRAKAEASMIFATAYMFVGFLAGVIGFGAAIGGYWGWNLPVQLLDNTIPYNFTMWQLCLLEFLMMLLVALSVTGVILLISAVTKSTLATVAGILVLLIAPAFMSFSKTNALYNHMIALVPVRILDVTNVLAFFYDYRFGSVIVDYLTMAFAATAIVFVLSLVPLRRVYVKRIVKM